MMARGCNLVLQRVSPLVLKITWHSYNACNVVAGGAAVGVVVGGGFAVVTLIMSSRKTRNTVCSHH